jgi:hypothetical protein
VGVAGSVTCGAITCSTTQGCSFNGNPSYSPTPPSCGSTVTNWYAGCDGPNDCPSGQVCCLMSPLAGRTTAENASCIASASCPYSGMSGSGQLVCDPGNPVCPGVTTCQAATSFMSVYVCK